VARLSPAECIDRLLTVPFRLGAGAWSGTDCWGVVELYYRHVLGIEVMDRSNNPPGHGGLQAGFDKYQDWTPIRKAEDHCIVVMRTHALKAGHIGVHYQGNVVHTDEHHGCIVQSLRHREIRTKVTVFGRHHEITP
jgi:hypothetical protein